MLTLLIYLARDRERKKKIIAWQFILGLSRNFNSIDMSTTSAQTCLGQYVCQNENAKAAQNKRSIPNKNLSALIIAGAIPASPPAPLLGGDHLAQTIKTGAQTMEASTCRARNIREKSNQNPQQARGSNVHFVPTHPPYPYPSETSPSEGEQQFLQHQKLL